MRDDSDIEVSTADVCSASWFLIHGTKEQGRGKPADNNLLDRSFWPTDRRYRFETHPETGEHVHTFDGQPICTEFYIPALLPDGFVLAVIGIEDRHKSLSQAGNGYIEAGVIPYDGMIDALIPALSKAEVVIYQPDLIEGLVRSMIGLPTCAPNEEETDHE